MSCSSFSGILLAEILTLPTTAQPQQLSRALKQNFVTSSVLHLLACLQNWCRVDSVAKFCCQPGLDPCPLNCSCNGFLMSAFAEIAFPGSFVSREALLWFLSYCVVTEQGFSLTLTGSFPYAPWPHLSTYPSSSPHPQQTTFLYPPPYLFFFTTDLDKSGEQ